MAARGISDNFVVKIKCGKCEHEWFDGVRYKNLTAVRCPNCKTINKVDSGISTRCCKGTSKRFLDSWGLLHSKLF